jgi:hypothetical protein
MNAHITEDLKILVSTLTNAEANQVIEWIRKTGIKAVTVEYVDVSVETHPFVN